MILSMWTHFHVLSVSSRLNSTSSHEFSEQEQKEEESFQSSARNILIILIHTCEKTEDHGSLSCWYFPRTDLAICFSIMLQNKRYSQKSSFMSTTWLLKN